MTETTTVGFMLSNESEDGLVAAAQAGDPEAFSALVERYRRVVFSYAYARTRNREEAEDLTQETFVRAYFNLSRVRSLAAWEAWMMRILRNLCNDSHRKKGVRLTVPIEVGERIGGPSAEAVAIAEAGERELQAAIDGLPEKYRVPLQLHYMSRLTYREIALALGIPVTTVRGRLAGALLLLRRKLAEEVHP